jgi:hypothetical protein
MALGKAREELQAAYEERAAIEQRIVHLTKTVEGLAALCEPEAGEEFLVSGERDHSSFQMTSLTDAIRRVFSEAEEPILSPTEVRDKLLAMGMDLNRYKQPLVPIHNTLKRLLAQEEIVEFRDDNNDLRGYRWISPLARAVAQVSDHPLRRIVAAPVRTPAEAKQRMEAWRSKK